MPPEPTDTSRHYALVAQAIAFIRQSARQQPSLDDVAQAVHVSPHHLQKLFAEWAGVSPKRFLQYLTKEHAKQQLRAAQPTLDVALSSGLSSTSRLHDLMVSCEAMTPGEIRSGGEGLTLTLGWADTPFGAALIGWTPRGICHFTFAGDAPEALEAELHALWPHGHWERSDAQAQAWAHTIFPRTPTRGEVHLVLRGTNFQIKVWEALLRIPQGRIVSYQQLAAQAGSPQAQRAVGSALAANTIGFLIPCHRVIRESGDSGHYRWGPDRKAAMLAWEAAQSQR